MIKKYIQRKPIILVINSYDNEEPYIKTLNQHYKVIQTRPTKIITNLAIELFPSLIILDGNEYGINLFHEFKSITSTKHIPILFDIIDIYTFPPKAALALGAIDYIYDSIDTSILKLKLDNYIRVYETIKALRMQANIAMESNPNTGLPGNNAIMSNICYTLDNNMDCVVVYADLDNFKAYNDTYGFARGDDVIKFTSDVIERSLEDIKGYKFVGHIGGDDYVFIAPRRTIKGISDYIINTFDNEIIKFYDHEAVKNKYITTQSRSGEIIKYPIMTISMGGVALIHHNADTRFEEISDLCSEVKRYAKTFPYSYFYLDKRNPNSSNDFLD